MSVDSKALGSRPEGAPSQPGGGAVRAGAAVRDWSAMYPRLAMLGFLLALIALFSILRPSEFPTMGNAQAILSQQAVPCILALAVTLPLLAGEFDLSLGATLGFVAVFAAWAFASGWGIPAVVIVSLAIGIAIGAVNVLLVVGVGLNSFIATLAVSTVLEGGSQLVSGGSTLYEDIPHALRSAGQTNVAEIPLVAIYAVVVAFILWYVTDLSPFGRRLRATGMGLDAARLIGVPTARYVTAGLVSAALVAALAGVILLAKTGSATPTTGTGLILPAYAAAFLGAATMKPTRFNVWGTLIAVLVLSVGISGLTMLGAPAWVPDVFNGTALALALAVSEIVGRRTGTRNR